MLILKKVTVGEDLVFISMTKTNIWVQVHQLPFGFMDMCVDALVGSHIGQMVKYDDENNYDPWRKYMRVRVKIDMEEPLKQDQVIERGEGDVMKEPLKRVKVRKTTRGRGGGVELCLRKLLPYVLKNCSQVQSLK